MKVNGVECIKCKGRLLCGLSSCKVLDRHKHKTRILSGIKSNSFDGSSPPGLFVSWQNYPKVDLAPLSSFSSISDIEVFDEPENWFGLPSEKIVSMRESLILSGKKTSVFSAVNPNKELSLIQETAMASDSLDVSVEVNKFFSQKISFDSFSSPLGPRAELKKFSLNSNPKIPKKIDYIVSDTDLISTSALEELYNSNISVTRLQKILSAGLLGLKKRRKLVPTRWSITAVDDTVSKKLIEKIKYFKETDFIQLFEENYLDNHFFVLLIPGYWSFEQLEAWKPESVWMQGSQTKIMADSELFKGRKNYASNVSGAYYAARLAVAEFLHEKRRQCKAIVFREIGEDYNTPLGVWVIRESIRNALRKKPLRFFDLELALNFLSKKLTVPIKNYVIESKILGDLKQKKLSDF